MSISEQLRQLILEQNASPTHLARLSYIDKASMSKFMNGGSLTLNAIDRLSEVIGLRLITTKYPEPAIQGRPKK